MTAFKSRVKRILSPLNLGLTRGSAKMLELILEGNIRRFMTYQLAPLLVKLIDGKEIEFIEAGSGRRSWVGLLKSATDWSSSLHRRGGASFSGG